MTGAPPAPEFKTFSGPDDMLHPHFACGEPGSVFLIAWGENEGDAIQMPSV